MVSGRGEDRARAGHPWIYKADVVEAMAKGGDTVVVLNPRGRIIGRAMYIDGYMKAAEKRGPGFGIGALAEILLLILALVGVVMAWMVAG